MDITAIGDEATVVVDEVIAGIVEKVEVDAWVTKFTVVVTVSWPPAIQAGWKSLPILLDCASAKVNV